MATLPDIARLTCLEDAEVEHLQRLVATWGFLADLCFADLLLFVPTEGQRESAERFIVVGQIRPTTSQTLYREDQVGRVVSAAECPLVGRAWRVGHIIDGEVEGSPR